jgi:hypothetical protein
MTEDIFHTVADAHNEALRHGVLNLWTIYDHPKDFPHSFVARRFAVDSNGARPTEDFVQGELSILRESFRYCGLTCLTRDEKDEPQIIESWL